VTNSSEPAENSRIDENASSTATTCMKEKREREGGLNDEQEQNHEEYYLGLLRGGHRFREERKVLE